MKTVLIMLADLMAAKLRFILLFLALSYLTVLMQMVLLGAGWFSLIFVGFMGIMLILLFWFAVRFWVGAASELVDRDV